MNQINDKRFHLWQWWAGVLEKKRQLNKLDEWTAEFDYFSIDDTGEWLTWVATEVLMLEYNRTGPQKLYNQIQFTTDLRKILVESRLKLREVKLVMRSGEIVQRRRFLIFKSCQWYKDRLYGKGYYSCFQ